MRVPLSNLYNSKNPQDFPSFITCKCYLDQGAATRITQTSVGIQILGGQTILGLTVSI